MKNWWLSIGIPSSSAQLEAIAGLRGVVECGYLGGRVSDEVLDHLRQRSRVGDSWHFAVLFLFFGEVHSRLGMFSSVGSGSFCVWDWGLCGWSSCVGGRGGVCRLVFISGTLGCGSSSWGGLGLTPWVRDWCLGVLWEVKLGTYFGHFLVWDLIEVQG